MDKLQADEVARAILEPDLEFHEKLRLRRAAEERSVSDRRKVAWCVLAGGAIGIVVALLSDAHFANGLVWGGIAGAALGWAGVTWRHHRTEKIETPAGG